MKPPLRGVIPILHTPYRADGSIDGASLVREIDWIFRVGADGCGIALASDLLRLTPDERLELADRVIRAVRGRGGVVVSVGAESARDAVRFGRAARKAGASAVMAIPPRRASSAEPALARYFGAIAESVDLPLIVQDASGYVGRPMTPAFQLRLLGRYGAGKIWFKPEAPPVGPFISALRAGSGGRAVVFEGSGGVLLVENFRRGVAGTMPGCDLLDAIVPLWRALRRGDGRTAYRLSFPVAAIALLEAQAGLDGYLAVERYLMKKRGIFASDRMRPPVGFRPDRPLLAEVDRLFARLRREVRAAR